MMIQKIRNNATKAFRNKKGFTLVEVIVVLVILAILAAILVPKLTGWIDESKDKTATGEAHLVLSALQAYGSEGYGNGTITAEITAVPTGDELKKINNYLDGDIALDATNFTAVSISAKGAINGFTYVATNDKVVTYSFTGGENGKGSFTVTDATPTT